MIRRTLAVVTLTVVTGAVLAVALVPATCLAKRAKITSLSRSSAKVGAKLTIRGNNFGLRQGISTVTFGELPQHTFADGYTLTPCSKEARVVSWSRSSITVRVPSMSPGLAGARGTHHPIYVTVRGKRSSRRDFYIRPAITIDANTPAAVVARIFPNSTRTVTDTTYTNSAGSKHSSYTTHLILDATNERINQAAGNALANNTHDILIKDVTFRDRNQCSGTGGGVLLLGSYPFRAWKSDHDSGIANAQNHYNITFYNCVVENNLKTVGEGSNGIKANNWNANSRMGDWTFSDCSIGTPNSRGKSFERMSVEMNEQDSGFSSYAGEVALHNIRFTGCDFEPAGTLAYSFVMGGLGVDDRGVQYNRGNLIDDCLFKGIGPNTANSWGEDYLEFHAYGLMVRDVDIWGGCDGGLLIHSGSWARGGAVQANAHICFKRFKLKTTVAYGAGAPTNRSVLFIPSDCNGVVWDHCDFDMGNASRHWGIAASARFATNNFGWDMSTSYMHGVTDERPSPASIYDYFSYWGCPNPATTYVPVFGTTRWAKFGTRP